MPNRTVKLLKIAYLNEDKVDAWGDRGEQVSVHADDVERFDRLNVVDADAEIEPPAEVKKTPQRRGRSRKDDDSVRDS